MSGYGMVRLVCMTLLFAMPLAAQESEGLAPEVTDLNAADISYALEAQLPDLQVPYLDPAPSNRRDGIAVGELGVDSGNRDAIMKFAMEIAAGDHGQIDSLLLYHRDKLLFESYYRRGRINYPHYQMSITKSYTAVAIGRAMQLGHLTMTDLDKPVVDFLKDLDQAQLAPGADEITLAEAMNMRSGVRLAPQEVTRLRNASELLQGQGQIQAYLQSSVRFRQCCASKSFSARPPQDDDGL